MRSLFPHGGGIARKMPSSIRCSDSITIVRIRTETLIGVSGIHRRSNFGKSGTAIPLAPLDAIFGNIRVLTHRPRQVNARTRHCGGDKSRWLCKRFGCFPYYRRKCREISGAVHRPHAIAIIRARQSAHIGIRNSFRHPNFLKICASRSLTPFNSVSGNARHLLSGNFRIGTHSPGKIDLRRRNNGTREACRLRWRHRIRCARH